MPPSPSHRCFALLQVRPILSGRLGPAWQAKQTHPTCRHSSSSLSTTASASAGGDKQTPAARLSTPNLVDTIQTNVNWFNQQYERTFGIAEIRTMQNKVLEAESDFVVITQRRKSCQEQIEQFKEEIKTIRDKLDTTPRQSDNYLRLITEEHKLLREQLALDAQLVQLKENEQLALDNLSKLLRQSHELERLRQERSKYWQIISISLSLAGSLVALMTQRARSQKSVMTRLTSIDEKFPSLEDSLSSQKLELDFIASQIERLNGLLEHINRTLESQTRPERLHTPAAQRSWWGWLPGRSALKSVVSYLW